MLRFSLIAALLSTLLYTPVMRAQEHLQQQRIQTSADRVHRGDETFFDVHAAAFVRATPQQVWAVLTDYDRLAEFVPDLYSSRVLSRSAGTTIVEQRSKAGFLFVSHDVHMVLRIKEQSFSTIDVALESGDMKHYSAHWELARSSQDGFDGTHITFVAAIEPDFFVPPLVANSIVESNVKHMVQAVLREIERRSAH
jgi:ribosome-associated toxin RatA of RatAB toxin-antitoxin module